MNKHFLNAATIGLCLFGFSPLLQGASDDAVIISRFNKNTIIVNAPAYDKVPASMLNKMNMRVTVNFQDLDLVEAIEQFQKLTGLNVVIDAELRVANTRSISLSASNMKADNLVKWLKQLGGIHVTYMNEAIYFSQDKPSGTRKIRMIDVSDLTMPVRDFPGARINIPSTNNDDGMIITEIEEAEAPEADDIIDVLKETLETQGVETE